VQEYHDKTCIRFRPRTSEQAYIHIMKEIVVFIPTMVHRRFCFMIVFLLPLNNNSNTHNVITLQTAIFLTINQLHRLQLVEKPTCPVIREIFKMGSLISLDGYEVFIGPDLMRPFF
jgi:hypothetical protein